MQLKSLQPYQDVSLNFNQKIGHQGEKRYKFISGCCKTQNKKAAQTDMQKMKCATTTYGT